MATATSPPTVEMLRQQQRNHGLERAGWLLTSPDPPAPWRTLYATVRKAVTPSSGKSKSRAVMFVEGLFPILKWGRTYKPAMFQNDVMAGLTLASLCIPQSIGYANLARLDPQYGLYASVVPPLIYALMGSSREIAIGPVAVVSLLLSAMVSKLVDPSVNSGLYTRLVLTVTFFVGIFQAIFGLFRLGFLIDFLSHAAVVGFMGGAAIVIGLQQLRGLFGLDHFTTKTDVVSVLEAVGKGLHQHFYPLNILLGSSFLLFILIARFIGKRNKKLFWIPAMAPLFSVIMSTVIVYLSRADRHGVKIIKHCKGGLNPSSIHLLDFGGEYLGEIAKIGLICALIALTEALAVGRSFASMNGYHLDGNKEMVAMGCMNIIGSFTSCYTTTGSFSRTAVNYSAGCKTVVSNIVMAITVLIALLSFAKLMYYTPLAILASIIISALPSLIDIHEAYNIWKVDKLDFVICIAAFLGVLFGSIEIGLLLAVGISFGKIILSTIMPSVEEVGRLPQTDIFCNTQQYPQVAAKLPGILLLRISSAALCFANANFIRQRIIKWVSNEVQREESSKGVVRVLILDMSYVTNVDMSGLDSVEELHKELASQGIQLAVANPRWEVIIKMRASKLVEKVGPEWFFLSVADAVEASYHLKTNGGIDDC